MVLKLKKRLYAFRAVWEWCKNVWYSNYRSSFWYSSTVWEWCKNVWYSNWKVLLRFHPCVWEWCKNVWYSNDANKILYIYEFENDVKMYGTQTLSKPLSQCIKFENDVKMYGTQTEQERCQCVSCLRMM